MLDIGTGLLFRIPALLITITVHEYAHGAVSFELGDPTPKLEGRLTMNPLAHLDPIGALMLVFVGFGWAKPVGINPSYYRNPRKDIMKVAFAGPGSNLLLCFMATLLIFIMAQLGVRSSGVRQFLYWLQMYNVWFAFFNLVPIPPLDGSKILLELLPGEMAYKYESSIAPYSMYILIALCITGIISIVVAPFATAYLSIVYGLLNIIF